MEKKPIGQRKEGGTPQHRMNHKQSIKKQSREVEKEAEIGNGIERKKGIG